MEPAAVPADEAGRLEALHALNVLDTAPEPRLDDVTRLAAMVFQVPIVLISLVDEDRQWFKACIGLDLNETSRDVSFCAHAILDDALFIVEDATADPRFADNPLVTGPPHIRFYAGRPLHGLGGRLVGTLCIIGDEPRTLDADEQARLDALGRWVELELVERQAGTRETLVRSVGRRRF